MDTRDFPPNKDKNLERGSIDTKEYELNFQLVRDKIKSEHKVHPQYFFLITIILFINNKEKTIYTFL